MTFVDFDGFSYRLLSQLALDGVGTARGGHMRSTTSPLCVPFTTVPSLVVRYVCRNRSSDRRVWCEGGGCILGGEKEEGEEGCDVADVYLTGERQIHR
ncbi:hypothetical protein NC651_038095 [Populus alba x Populus x berolinensis]|nr:hypothetical protein NC651_038095 [Populus alba x Populus x berolinensis]